MPALPPRSIMIVDDHPAVLIGLGYAFQREWPECQVHSVNSGMDAIKALPDIKPDLVLLDYQMPQMSGYETALEMLRLNATTPILLFTHLDSLAIAINFLAIGGKGFITKGVKLPTLIEAIHKVRAGEYYFHSHYDQQLSEMVHQGISTNLPKIQFTLRELEICLKLSKGLTAKIIADELNLSPRTVESYKEALMAKTGVKTTAELIAFIFRNGVDTKWFYE